MRKPVPSFRSLVQADGLVRVVGAHTALGATIAEEAGFDAVWSSSLEVSASRALPDSSLLTMTEYLEAAANMQKAIGVPVVADCDSGYGNNANARHMVHEYEAAGITAISVEDKKFPKMNSFADRGDSLVTTDDFCRKLTTAKNAQTNSDFFVIARTEALINGRPVREALDRARAYADSGADAILIHSKEKTNEEILAFLEGWEAKLPVVVVPTTYPDWSARDMAAAGVSVVIYANQGLRSTISALRGTYASILDNGDTVKLEYDLAPVSDIFAYQELASWQALD
ncbi:MULTISPECIES: isocitrate lyase/phosphoenolpyruvate mutase family protein [unclassified Streptomyces]|uniref:isocitrate lyase/phosphoenolpyruvate mutase family protein n=1 Tax=unclassified Streptomyces TaxID=2593676 RepID=UPI0006AE0265|nr:MULTISPECIES: isocitrate lyase/phosphoenolpyruvate mutase family protein [unclassified Streptomyces]KOX33017.1 phosphoenolpyruvate phosphomutase [Streptomyces sp. NRRL F-6491]KOX49517.1 phosphoenolpyruvate phosphomutase [Streptomyces sp. NRRL F-6492]